jgi:hypothetical protein
LRKAVPLAGTEAVGQDYSWLCSAVCLNIDHCWSDRDAQAARLESGYGLPGRKKYQQSVCSSACLCGNSDHRARVLSRRGFLARSAAAAPERACAQTMGITKQIFGRPGQEVVAALDSDNDRLVPTYKDLRQNPKGFHGSPQKSGSIANQLSELGFQVKSQSARRALSVSRKWCRTVGHLLPDVDVNAGPEGMTKPRRLGQSLR